MKLYLNFNISVILLLFCLSSANAEEFSAYSSCDENPELKVAKPATTGTEKKNTAGAGGAAVHTDFGIRRALEQLAVRQEADGSFFDPDVPYGGDAAVTALCGLAFLSDGSTPNRGPFGNEVSLCVEYMLSIVQPNGFINDYRRESLRPMYGQGYGLLFLCETFGMTEQPKFREKIRKAIDLLVKTQNAEGGWRYFPNQKEPIADISVTSCQLIALRSAKNAGFYVPNSTIEKAVDFIKKCQNPDGGFKYLPSELGGESGFARSATALAALQSAGLYKDESVQKGFVFLSKYAVPPAKIEHFHYGHYYAAIAIWLADEESPIEFTKWHPAIAEQLLKIRQPEGDWRSIRGEMPRDCATAMSCIILSLPRQKTPNLIR